MATFQFRGRNLRGELVTGAMVAPDPEGVAARMLSAGLQPVSITEQAAQRADPEWFRSFTGAGAMGGKDLLLFTRQMGSMLKAGVPILQVLRSIQASTTQPHIVKILQAVRDDLDRGLELSAAFARHPKSFSDFYVSMISVGEGAGQLDSIFARLHQQLQFDMDMNLKIKATMRYPMFVLSAISIAMVILSIFVIPIFSNMFASMKVELPLITRILIGFSDFMVHYWWAAVAGVIGAIYGIRYVIGTRDGRYQWDRRKLKIPVLGSVIYKGTMARFAYTFALAERSGVPLLQAFSLLSRVVDNAYFAERILGMRDGVENGESLARVAQTCGIFSQIEIQMITVGEEAGAVEEMLVEVAEMYQGEVNHEVAKLSQALEPIMIALMAGLVLVLMLGILLPLWDLSSSASIRK